MSEDFGMFIIVIPSEELYEIMDLKGGNKFGMCNLSQSINSPCMSLVISIIDFKYFKLFIWRYSIL